MTEVEKQSYEYYKKALVDGSHVAYLVFDGKRFVGAGGVSFYYVMPTFHNPTGRKAKPVTWVLLFCVRLLLYLEFQEQVEHHF